MPDSLEQLGCADDFALLASRPLDALLPQASSVKVTIDLADDLRLHFQDSDRYPTHYSFAVEHLNGGDLPPVTDVALFQQVEYYLPTRRFLLGAVTHYEGPDVHALEIAPYDSMTAEQLERLFTTVQAGSWFGEDLVLHANATRIEELAGQLPSTIPVVTTGALLEGIRYQPLTLGEAVGRLTFVEVDAMDETLLGPRDVVVLDRLPPDLPVVAGLVTAELQTPLAHVNVLSRSRGTPNMALPGAFDAPNLRALEGQWVRLEIEAFEHRLTAVGVEEADAWWEANRPEPVHVPPLDRETTALVDADQLDLDSIPAYGGKAAHYGVLSRLDPAIVPRPTAFAVPVHYYFEFVGQNGFDATIAGMLADPGFQADAAVRRARLAQLEDDMRAAPVDPDFLEALTTKIRDDHPGVRIRVRSSTNAEDLPGFTGAGLYRSASAELDDPDRPLDDAVREVWASLWSFGAFEERSWAGIPHDGVGMALLVHHAFPDEEANGVALTANPFHSQEPAFVVNAQVGEASVVDPAPGVTVDAFVYRWAYPGQPMTFLTRSNLVPAGETVLSTPQADALGGALDAIHDAFEPYYGGSEVWAMDVEFKFDDLGSGDDPSLFVKQARPYAAGRGTR